MLEAASSYSQSTAGYVNTILLGLLITVGGYVWRRQDHKLDALDTKQDKHGEALALLSTSNAVLVSQLAPQQDLVNTHGAQIASLDRSMGILKEVMDRHERWHETHHGES